MGKKSKIVSLILILTLLIGAVMPAISVFAAAPASKENFGDISFGGNVTSIQEVSDASSITIQYENGTAVVTGSNLYSEKTEGPDGNNNIVDKFIVYGLGNISVSTTPNTGFTADIWENGTDLHVNSANFNLTAGNHLNLDVLFNDGSEYTGGPVPIDGGTLITSTFSYTNAGEEPADIWVNQTAVGVGESPNGERSYYYVTSAGTVQFKFATFVNNRLTSITINGTDYTNQLPTTKEGWLEANEGQTDAVYITVPYAATYNITTSTTRDFEWSIANFLWSNDCDPRNDNYIKNGKVEFVSLEYKGTTYTGLEELRNAHKNYLFFDELEQGEKDGSAVLPAGSILTVKLLPNKGYQLVSFSCNGQDFEPQEEIGTYTFEVPKGNFHWGAKFKQVDNVVKSDTNKIDSGDIELGGSEQSMNIGTARLDVKDTELEPEQISNFEEAAGDYKISSYIDISLFNTVYKATENESWDTRVRELDHKATITLKLADGVDGNDIVIVHEKHDGTYEVIETTYDSTTHTVTFVTDSFSNYAIAARTVSTKNVKTTDNIEIYFITLLSSLIGLVSIEILRRKKALVK